MKESYFLIETSSNGARVSELAKEDLLARMPGLVGCELAVDDLIDLMELSGYMIIKGKRVSPKQVQVVTKFEIE